MPSGCLVIAQAIIVIGHVQPQLPDGPGGFALLAILPNLRRTTVTIAGTPGRTAPPGSAFQTARAVNYNLFHVLVPSCPDIRHYWMDGTNLEIGTVIEEDGLPSNAIISFRIVT